MYGVEGSRPRGRPKREVVQKDCQAHSLNKKDAMYCTRRRNSGGSRGGGFVKFGRTPLQPVWWLKKLELLGCIKIVQ